MGFIGSFFKAVVSAFTFKPYRVARKTEAGWQMLETGYDDLHYAKKGRDEANKVSRLTYYVIEVDNDENIIKEHG